MIKIADAAKYDQGLARQLDAWRYLRQEAPAKAWDALQAQLPAPVVKEFARRFRSGSKPAAAAPALQQSHSKALNVPYYSQRDNYRDADRTCFSSACAMALKYLIPGSISSDDQYIRTVFSIGDTTIAAVQTTALSRYGLRAVFRTNANFDTIRSEINIGYPVPFGYLHRGLPSAPTGGHWAVAIGYTASSLIVHDPYGQPDLVHGTTLSRQGQRLQFDYRQLQPRWLPKGNDGWCMILRKI